MDYVFPMVVVSIESVLSDLLPNNQRGDASHFCSVCLLKIRIGMNALGVYRLVRDPKNCRFPDGRRLNASPCDNRMK